MVGKVEGKVTFHPDLNRPFDGQVTAERGRLTSS